MGILEYNAVADATTSIVTQVKKRNSYQRWTASERFEIGKYGAQNGAVAVVRKFSENEKPLNESSTEGSLNFIRANLRKL